MKSPEYFSRPEYFLSSEEFKITKESIINACKELKSNSAPGPDGVPAEVLIKCREAVSTPLAILWGESFARRTVPAYYKHSLYALYIRRAIDHCLPITDQLAWHPM